MHAEPIEEAFRLISATYADKPPAVGMLAIRAAMRAVRLSEQMAFLRYVNIVP